MCQTICSHHLILRDIHYLKTPCSDYLTTALNTVADIHTTQPAGDILVFLTGQEEIDTLVDLVKDKSAELLHEGKVKGTVIAHVRSVLFLLCFSYNLFARLV